MNTQNDPMTISAIHNLLQTETPLNWLLSIELDRRFLQRNER